MDATGWVWGIGRLWEFESFGVAWTIRLKRMVAGKIFDQMIAYPLRCNLFFDAIATYVT